MSIDTQIQLDRLPKLIEAIAVFQNAFGHACTELTGARIAERYQGDFANAKANAIAAAQSLETAIREYQIAYSFVLRGAEHGECVAPAPFDTAMAITQLSVFRVTIGIGHFQGAQIWYNKATNERYFITWHRALNPDGKAFEGFSLRMNIDGHSDYADVHGDMHDLFGFKPIGEI